MTITSLSSKTLCYYNSKTVVLMTTWNEMKNLDAVWHADLIMSQYVDKYEHISFSFLQHNVLFNLYIYNIRKYEMFVNSIRIANNFCDHIKQKFLYFCEIRKTTTYKKVFFILLRMPKLIYFGWIKYSFYHELFILWLHSNFYLINNETNLLKLYNFHQTDLIHSLAIILRIISLVLNWY